MLICLDTSILLSFSNRGERNKTDYNEYLSIIKIGGPFSKWSHILYTQHNLILSPFTFWEFCCNDLENLCKNHFPYDQAFMRTLENLEKIKNTFVSTSKIDSKIPLIGTLFGAATGVSCDDAFHFIYAINNNANFFATDNKKHFKFLLKTYNKNEIIKKMLDLLKKYPISNFWSEWRIKQEIKRLKKITWPEVLASPASIPYP